MSDPTGSTGLAAQLRPRNEGAHLNAPASVQLRTASPYAGRGRGLQHQARLACVGCRCATQQRPVHGMASPHTGNSFLAWLLIGVSDQPSLIGPDLFRLYQWHLLHHLLESTFGTLPGSHGCHYKHPTIVHVELIFRVFPSRITWFRSLVRGSCGTMCMPVSVRRRTESAKSRLCKGRYYSDIV